MTIQFRWNQKFSKEYILSSSCRPKYFEVWFSSSMRCTFTFGIFFKSTSVFVYESQFHATAMIERCSFEQTHFKWMNIGTLTKNIFLHCRIDLRKIIRRTWPWMQFSVWFTSFEVFNRFYFILHRMIKIKIIANHLLIFLVDDVGNMKPQFWCLLKNNVFEKLFRSDTYTNWNNVFTWYQREWIKCIDI